MNGIPNQELQVRPAASQRVSYNSHLFKTAWTDTVGFFKEHIGGSVIGVLVLGGIGWFVRYIMRDQGAATDHVVDIIYSFGTAFIGAFFLFLYQICYCVPRKLVAGKQRQIDDERSSHALGIELERDAVREAIRERDQLQKRLDARPSLEMFYDAKDGECLKKGGGDPGFFWLFRLGVIARNGEVNHCRGYLTKVERNGLQTFGGNKAQLTFAPAEKPDALDKRIAKNSRENLDVLDVNTPGVRVIRVENEAWFTHFEPINEIFPTYGDYVITIRVEGSEADTVEARFKLHLNGSESTFVQLEHSHEVVLVTH